MMQSSSWIRSILRSRSSFLLIGLGVALRVPVVVRCRPDISGAIRLISARRVSRSERGQYVAQWK